MSRINRRKFIGAAGAVIAGGVVARRGLRAEAVAAPAALGPVDRSIKSPTDRVSLGRSGLKVSFVGVGTGSIGYAHHSNQTLL